MISPAWIPLLLTMWTGAQTVESPAYVHEGDRIEQQFRAYRDRLAQFFGSLRGLIRQQSPGIQLAPLQEAPAPVLYGYGVLPRIADPPEDGVSNPVTVFSYSWPITEGYIAGETVQLERAETEMRDVTNAAEEAKPGLIASLVRQYRAMAGNQCTIDQYLQYPPIQPRRTCTRAFSPLQRGRAAEGGRGSLTHIATQIL